MEKAKTKQRHHPSTSRGLKRGIREKKDNRRKREEKKSKYSEATESKKRHIHQQRIGRDGKSKGKNACKPWAVIGDSTTKGNKRS